MTRQNLASGAPWEDRVGYSRAVRVKSHVWVSGTTATDERGTVVGEGDAEAQTEHILQKIEHALTQAGAALTHVVRTRIYVTDISDWEKIGRAHARFFGDIRPAATMVEVRRLIDDRLLVEIEVDAMIA